MSLVFTDSSHWYQICITCFMLQYSIHFVWVLDAGWLMVYARCIIGCGEVKVDIMLLLIANNCWTRSFALGYWLFYFSSVLTQMRKENLCRKKIISSESVCCLIYPCPYWGQSIFVTVSKYCVEPTYCWITHGEAHDISTCLVFALKSVLPYEVYT